ncbi:MAG: site-2 protease family protein [Candidatus Woesearchaeota archaeon]
MGFFQDYRWVILFYSTIILLVYIFRKKFDVHHKFLAMYRTKVGIKLMDKIGVKHSETVKLLGYIGIGVGYSGLVLIVYYLMKNLFNLLTVPTATSAISLVIPGVKIPGSPIMIPLITGWIALFIVILVHEFSHGVVARAHKIPVKSSGIFFMGPLMGAFVEPEEKKLRKASDTTQYSVYAAGPFSNVLLAMLCLFMLTYAFDPVLSSMSTEVGVSVVGVTEGYPAMDAGLEGGMVITAVNDVSITNHAKFTETMQDIGPGEEITITTDSAVYDIVTVENPSDAKKGYIGIMASTKSKTELNNQASYYKILHRILMWLGELMAITGLLSLGIGLANLLPLGPVDGGRMLQVSLEKIKGLETGESWWRKVSVATLCLLAINIFWPVIKWVTGQIGKIFL